ncbi:ribosomal-protein-alanine N-acetyltransferase [Kitasatospora sp. MAA4]|uniref:GNAT family N-acetyltransferase n=1 Tax=Kitasatospora sp. MAA4 TaxID=3035093 RepID=UPI002473E837|nr:GNAT family N-acetyltransferase [Kitasatospora sp. MAA4]MDH6135140.1 ribosomal-protein-alanine N-acetyltransferase [Kitasatospora sp. MAA4]
MIRLRELRAGDERVLQRIYCHESVRYLGRGPMGEDEARLYIRRAAAASEQSPRTQFIFGIEATGDLVGIAKLNTAHGDGALSYILRPDAWGQGYATEAVTRLLALAFGAALRIPLVRAKHHSGNSASGRVLIKAGFSRTVAEGGFELYEIRSPCP